LQSKFRPNNRSKLHVDRIVGARSDGERHDADAGRGSLGIHLAAIAALIISRLESRSVNTPAGYREGRRARRAERDWLAFFLDDFMRANGPNIFLISVIFRKSPSSFSSTPIVGVADDAALSAGRRRSKVRWGDELTGSQRTCDARSRPSP